MKLTQVYTVVNNQLVITLPDSFKGKQKVTVTLEDSIDLKLEKMNLLAQASTDPLFISDIREIAEDFQLSDTE